MAGKDQNAFNTSGSTLAHETSDEVPKVVAAVLLPPRVSLAVVFVITSLPEGSFETLSRPKKL